MSRFNEDVPLSTNEELKFEKLCKCGDIECAVKEESADYPPLLTEEEMVSGKFIPVEA